MVESNVGAAGIREVENFTRILEQAVHDAQHELVGAGRVVHFWDDDSLNVPIRGFAALQRSRQDADSKLVQALFAAGFLGSVSLLRPHRSELIGLIARWEQERPSAGDHRIGLGEALSLAEVRDVLDVTAELEQLGPDLSNEDISTVLERLRMLSAASFTVIESLAGDWRARLANLVGRQHILDLRLWGPPLTEVRDSPDFGRIAEDLGARTVSPLAAAIDAAALSTLIAMNQSARAGASALYPRFYTSSNALRSYYRRSSWLRSQLAFDAPNARQSATVWRESDYYILRASFPELRLNVRDTAGPDTQLALWELQDLVTQLNDALESSADRVSRIIRQKVFSSRVPLSELVSRLEDSKMSAFWLQYNPARLPGELVTSLARLNRLSGDKRSWEQQEEFEAQVEGDLRDEIADYKVSIETVNAVATSVRQLARVLKRSSLSVTHDFASVRWGLEYDEKDPADVIKLRSRGGLMMVDLDELLRAFDLDSLRDQPSETLRTVALLLGLEKYDLADELLLRVDQGQASSTHRLMSAVALLGRRSPLSESQLLFIVEVLQNEWKLLDESDKQRLVLGFGFAAFAAWNRSVTGGAWSSELRDDNGWARWSVDIIDEYLDRLSPNAYIYGVNHLVYVATRLDWPVPRGESLIFDLERNALRMDEYRFLDTAALALLRLARSSVLEDGERQELRTRARTYLERAAAIVPGDIEVRQHLESLVLQGG